jgi:lysophospholipid acyltransferase (LPLAT)-like uncharacterized protein
MLRGPPTAVAVAARLFTLICCGAIEVAGSSPGSRSRGGWRALHRMKSWFHPGSDAGIAASRSPGPALVSAERLTGKKDKDAHSAEQNRRLHA